MSHPKRQHHWIERTIADITSAIERAIFTEEHARSDGLLQRLDPRAKLFMFLLTVLVAGLSRSLLTLLTLYLVLLIMAATSKIPFSFFVGRVWGGIPFFAVLVILPATFFTTEPRLFTVPLGPFYFGPSLASIYSASIFILRVTVSVSLAVLLILTTPWADLLKSLRILCVPQLFILLLSMTYRYLFLFLHTINGMFEARKSRIVGSISGADQRRWISTSMSALLHRSFQLSTNVYSAMVARGFRGEVQTYRSYRMLPGDLLAVLVTCFLAVILFIGGQLIP